MVDNLCRGKGRVLRDICEKLTPKTFHIAVVIL